MMSTQQSTKCTTPKTIIDHTYRVKAKACKAKKRTDVKTKELIIKSKCYMTKMTLQRIQTDALHADEVLSPILALWDCINRPIRLKTQ